MTTNSEQLVAFGKKIKASGEPNAQALKDFGLDVTAGLELASPARCPHMDTSRGLMLVGIGTALLYRASTKVASEPGEEAIALEYAEAIGRAKVSKEMEACVLHGVLKMLKGLL